MGGPTPSDSFFTGYGVHVDEIRPNNLEKQLVIGDNQSSLRTEGGTIINYAHTVFDAQYTLSSGLTTFTEITGLSCVFERKYDRSDVLVQWNLHLGGSYYQISGRVLLRTANNMDNLDQDPPTNVAIASEAGRLGTAPGTRTATTFNTINYIKGGTFSQYSQHNETGSYLYKNILANGLERYCRADIEIRGYSDTHPIYINRKHSWNDFNSYDNVPISTLTMFEMAYNN